MGLSRGPGVEQRSSQNDLDDFQFCPRLCKVLTEEPTDLSLAACLGWMETNELSPVVNSGIERILVKTPKK